MAPSGEATSSGCLPRPNPKFLFVLCIQGDASLHVYDGFRPSGGDRNPSYTCREAFSWMLPCMCMTDFGPQEETEIRHTHAGKIFHGCVPACV